MRKLLLLSFPYKTDAKENSFPVIPLSLKFSNKKKEFFALVDSGATISIFGHEVAESLGIDVTSGQEIYIGGVGGRIKGYIHKLEVEIAGKQFICPMVFSYEYLVSFNLLGRATFFKKFKITFEEENNKVTLV